MYDGSIPATSIYNTWIGEVEISSADDGQLVDLSAAVEITLRLVDPRTRLDDLDLTLSGGQITLPSLGIIQWRAEVTQMAILLTKLYELILLVDDGDTVTALIVGNISIVE